MKEDRYPSIKIWSKTRRLLRKLSAELSESMVEILDRLVEVEWKRIQEMEKNNINDR